MSGNKAAFTVNTSSVIVGCVQNHPAGMLQILAQFQGIINMTMVSITKLINRILV